VTDAKQASLITNGLRRLNRSRWAGPAFLFSYRDKGTNASDIEQNFGIVRYDWSPKPAYAAYRSTAKRLSR
jgi:polysaccharide biosynthesis protein PslG